MSCVQPTPQRLREVAEPGCLVPLVRVIAAASELPSPLGAFAVLAHGSRHAALLETAPGEAGAGDEHVSIVVPGAREVLTCRDSSDDVDVLAALGGRLARRILRDVSGVGLPRFIGGAVGYIGHDHVRRLEPSIGDPLGRPPIHLPESVLLVADTLVVFDHVAGHVLLVTLVDVPATLDDSPTATRARLLDDLHEAATARLDALASQLGAAREQGRRLDACIDAAMDLATPTPPQVKPLANMTRAAFEAMVVDAREHVLAGDIVQAVVSQRFDCDVDVDPLLAWAAMRRVSPAPYGFLLRVGDAHLVGASPERLVRVEGGLVSTHPIAGTRGRGADDVADRALAAELLADPKERSEHTMLVDLARNDVGRVCATGTISVPRYMHVTTHSHVLHLSSEVHGMLRVGCTGIDALAAAFPAGTLSGAPKLRALQLIAALEPDARGPYGGAVGWIGLDGDLDLAIAIRMLALAPGIASIQAGAGIVAGSDPASEWAETRSKARAALAALELAVRATRGARSAKVATDVGASAVPA